MEYIKLLRVNQWIKNIAVFVPIFFAGKILDSTMILLAAYAFISLSLISSSIYVLNDLFDVERDKLHSEKKNRPLASGKISKSMGVLLVILLAGSAAAVGYFLVGSEYFLLLLALYFFLMFLYSVWLKHIGITDAIIISLGFVLRVVAGAVLLELNISAMLLVCIIGGALLISFGKRRAEVSVMGEVGAKKHRPALAIYPKGVLDQIITTVSAVTFSAYIIYAYSFETHGLGNILEVYLPPRFKQPQWLLLTIPFAFYVLARYIVVINSKESGVPEDIWFKDRGLKYGLILWIILLFLLIYFDQLHTMVTV